MNNTNNFDKSVNLPQGNPQPFICDSFKVNITATTKIVVILGNVVHKAKAADLGILQG